MTVVSKCAQISCFWAICLSF